MILPLALLLAAAPLEADAFRQRTGISVACYAECPPWAPAALADFEAALAALPEKVRRPEGLRIVLRTWDMPFGMGDGSVRRPEWAGNDFFVYGVAPTVERRARLRLSHLTAEEQRSLWHRRALVHALVKRADDAQGFSKTRRWQRLSGWNRSINVFEGAYSRLRGMASAQLDLVTFAEEHFVPVPGVEVDDSVACHELSKSRVLHELIVGTPYVRPPCPRFEGWAALDRLESIEVLLVASSGRRPESLFGHLLLRPTHRASQFVAGPTFQSAVQIAAITDGSQGGPSYLVNGVFGGFRTAVFTLSWRDLEREVLEDEQRLIRRFRLSLSAAENEQVMERIWDLERRGYFTYKFFTENCATTLVQLIESALDEETELELPGSLIAAPSSALDGLARVSRVRDGRRVSLLQRFGADLEPSGLVAERGLAMRLDAQQRWLFSREPFERAALQRLFDRLGDEDRAEAYRELSTFVPRSDAERRAQFDFWLGAVRVERFGVDRARKALMQLSIDSLLKRPEPASPDAQLSERQRMFERETELAKHHSELDRSEAAREIIARLPHRPLTDSELEEQRTHLATISLFATVTSLHGDVIERDHSIGTVQDALRTEETQLLSREREWEPSALLSSGAWRLGAGGSFDLRRGGLRVHSAALSERLGDQRVRGFQPSTELHFLDADTTFVMGDGVLPSVSRSDFVLFGWRSLGRSPAPLRRSIRESFGYGFSFATDRRDHRVLTDRARLDGEVLAVVDEAVTFARHVALGLGPRIAGAYGPAGFGFVGGPRAVLLSRFPLFGHGANALRVESSFAPVWLAGAQRGFQFEASAAAEFDLRLVVAGGVVLVRPRLSFEMEGPARVGVGSVVIEPVEWVD